MTSNHVRTWEVTESRGYETAWAELGGTTLQARGRAVGTVPEPYWIAYELQTGADFVTRRLQVQAETAAGSRELDLRRDQDGRWSADGVPLPDLDGALDCDLGFCPLTNTMPVLRHRLHRAPGKQELLMAFVSVPDLGVQPSRQTYTHLGSTADGARIRFASGSFQSELEFDADGLVVDYPGMARRLPG